MAALGVAYDENLMRSLLELGPDDEYLENGYNLMCAEGQGCLVHIGATSRSKLMGERMGGIQANWWWAGWEASEQSRLDSLGARVLEAVPRDAPHHRRPHCAKYLRPSADRYLLVPARRERWGLLRALADHLGDLARRASRAIQEGDQEEVRRCMGRCWAW